MARWISLSVVVALLFGGVGIALGRASGRDASTPEPAECAVVTLPEPAVVPEATPSEPAPAPVVTPSPVVETPSEPGLPRVRRLVVTSGVDRHEPMDDLDEVRLGDGPVYAFVDAANAGGETELTVTFEHEGSSRTTGNVDLEVPSHVGRYRTWAFTRGIRTEGLWYAVVRDEDGRELAREAFDVIGAE